MANVVYAIRPVLCCDYNGVSYECPDNILTEHLRRTLWRRMIKTGPQELHEAPHRKDTATPAPTKTGPL
jgi:hypothetical protein